MSTPSPHSEGPASSSKKKPVRLWLKRYLPALLYGWFWFGALECAGGTPGQSGWSGEFSGHRGLASLDDGWPFWRRDSAGLLAQGLGALEIGQLLPRGHRKAFIRQMESVSQ
jgi:hypothetical protein